MVGVLVPIIPVNAEPTVHKVEIKEFTFQPHDVVVKTGDIVEFTNSDYAPHTATANNGSFDTKHLGKDGVARIVAGKPGTYDYICSFHPNMKGKIVVE